MSAPVAFRPASEGSINIHDTHVGVWEETHDFTTAKAIYQSTLAMLRRRGWSIKQDASVDRIIRADYHYGRKGGLEFSSDTCGRTCRFEFYQNVTKSENPNGGRYDFNRLAKFPKLLAMQYIVEGAAILRHVRRRAGYTVKGGDPSPEANMLRAMRDALAPKDYTSDVLAAFNAQWGADRFKRGEDGWPLPADCSGYGTPCKDRDGRPMVPGAVKFYRHHSGRLWRGRVYPAMGGMWTIIAGGEWSKENACHFFDYAGEPLGRVSPKTKQRLQREIDKSAKAMDFERAIVLRDVLRKVAA